MKEKKNKKIKQLIPLFALTVIDNIIINLVAGEVYYIGKNLKKRKQYGIYEG